jgi:hypothetical protein
MVMLPNAMGARHPNKPCMLCSTPSLRRASAFSIQHPKPYAVHHPATHNGARVVDEHMYTCP